MDEQPKAGEGDGSLKVRCRTCLGPGAVPLWEGVPPLAEKVARITHIKLDPLDAGPRLLCCSCLYELDAACRYRARAKSADRKLRKLLDRNDDRPLSAYVEIEAPSDIKKEVSRSPSPDPLRAEDVEEKWDGRRARKDSDRSYEPEASASESIASEPPGKRQPVPKKRRRSAKRPGDERKLKLPPKPSRGPHACHHCFKILPSPSSLKNHIRNHLKAPNHPCDKCGKRFKYPDNLRTHMMIHTGEKPYACNLCKKSFNKKDNFELHQKRHYKQRNFSCHQCGSSHYTRYELKTHMHKHTGEKPHVCTHCGKRFTAKSNLYIHQYKHTGEKPFVCTVCGKRYTSKNILAIHSRIHTGEKPYICSVCGKRFTANKLSVHMRTHTGEKPHVCSLCGKQFGTTNVLAIHMRRHTGEKPYKCKVCDQRYGHTQSLNKHMRKKHEIFTDVMLKRVQQRGKDEQQVLCIKDEQNQSTDLIATPLETQIIIQEPNLQSNLIQPTSAVLINTKSSSAPTRSFYIEHAGQDEIQLSAVNINNAPLAKEVYKLDMKSYM